MDAFWAGMAILIDPYMLTVILAGAVLGVVVGALPGLSGSTTAALLLPLTIGMGPIASIAFLGAIYCAANFGGSITAILINTPGDPSASATAYDGYPMAARGEAGRALGDRKSTRLNSSHSQISYAVFCLKKKNYIKDNMYAFR